MAGHFLCLGHDVRAERNHKVNRLLTSSCEAPDEKLRVLIKKGPISVETSLKELEENYAVKPEWKVIEEGGVLSIPVEEFRMINLPKPDRSGKVEFEQKKGNGAGNQIENYPVGQTIKNLNEKIVVKYNEERERAKSAGKSKSGAENAAQARAKKLPELTAVQKWQDNEAEIKLKKALEKMMTNLRIPALIIRSINLKAISALKEFGLSLPGDAEIDLIMAYVCLDFLHLNIFEVKRANTNPWQTHSTIPNKQAVNKAEIQLLKTLLKRGCICSDWWGRRGLREELKPLDGHLPRALSGRRCEEPVMAPSGGGGDDPEWMPKASRWTERMRNTWGKRRYRRGFAGRGPGCKLGCWGRRQLG